MDAWAPLGLISTTAALLALPMAPAFYELRKRADIAPLPTSRHDGRIENFSEAFYSRIEPLRPQLQECLRTGEIRRTNVEGMEVLLVGRDGFDFDADLLRGISAVVFASRALVPGGRIVNADLYSDTALRIGRGTAIRAGLSAGNVIFEEGSSVLRWLHAFGNVEMRQGSTSYGRLSSLQEIHFRAGSAFQRVNASRIVTGDSELSLSVPEFPDQPCYSRTGGLALPAPPRVRVHGDFVLPAGESMTGNLIVTGELHFGADSRFSGNAKSYKDTVVEEGAMVQGPIVCGGTVCLRSRSFVAGPIIAERDVLIGRGVCVGTLDAPTTVSCCRTQICSGCQLHGSIWARVRGTVED
jgi:hypothetical protein